MFRNKTYLSVFVQNISEEPVGVWESLRAGAFPNTHHAVLLRMQDPTLRVEERERVYSGQPTPLSLAIASSKERVELLTIELRLNY